MTSVAPVSPPRELPGPSPTLRTLHQVERIFRAAHANDEGPLTLAEIKRRLPAKTVRHATIRACVEELKRLYLVTEDPKRGVMWTLYENPAFWQRKRWLKL